MDFDQFNDTNSIDVHNTLLSDLIEGLSELKRRLKEDGFNDALVFIPGMSRLGYPSAVEKLHPKEGNDYDLPRIYMQPADYDEYKNIQHYEYDGGQFHQVTLKI